MLHWLVLCKKLLKSEAWGWHSFPSFSFSFWWLRVTFGENSNKNLKGAMSQHSELPLNFSSLRLPPSLILSYSLIIFFTYLYKHTLKITTFEINSTPWFFTLFTYLLYYTVHSIRKTPVPHLHRHLEMAFLYSNQMTLYKTDILLR